MHAIYEKYRDNLLRLAAGLLKEKSDAEDVVHEVFAAFADSAGSFHLTGSLGGYLATCVANKARNINRQNSRHQTVSFDDTDQPACRFKRPDEWIIYDEQTRLLFDAMGQLPYEQREAVSLHLQGDMKFKEIAKLQRTSVKTVLSRYRYGLTKLRSILNSEVTNETRR